MLVLTRKQSERVLIPELDIEVEVLGVSGGRVKLGFNAPKYVRILRSEVSEDRLSHASAEQSQSVTAE